MNVICESLLKIFKQIKFAIEKIYSQLLCYDLDFCVFFF